MLAPLRSRPWVAYAPPRSVFRSSGRPATRRSRPQTYHVSFNCFFLAVSLARLVRRIRPAIYHGGPSVASLANYLLHASARSACISAVSKSYRALLYFLRRQLRSLAFCAKSSLRARWSCAEAAERAKDDVHGHSRHELRSPLAVIHYANVARSHRQAGETAADQVDLIERQVQQLDSNDSGPARYLPRCPRQDSASNLQHDRRGEPSSNGAVEKARPTIIQPRT